MLVPVCIQANTTAPSQGSWSDSLSYYTGGNAPVLVDRQTYDPGVNPRISVELWKFYVPFNQAADTLTYTPGSTSTRVGFCGATWVGCEDDFSNIHFQAATNANQPALTLPNALRDGDSGALYIGIKVGTSITVNTSLPSGYTLIQNTRIAGNTISLTTVYDTTSPTVSGVTDTGGSGALYSLGWLIEMKRLTFTSGMNPWDTGSTLSVDQNSSPKGYKIIAGNHTGSAYRSCRSVNSWGAAKKYWEVECVRVTAGNERIAIGVATSGQSLTNYVGNSVNGVSLFLSGNQGTGTKSAIWHNGAVVVEYATLATADILSVFFDGNTKTIWFTKDAGSTYLDGGDPLAPSGGRVISTLGASPWYATATCTQSQNECVIFRLRPSQFTNTTLWANAQSAGYTAIDSDGSSPLASAGAAVASFVGITRQVTSLAASGVGAASWVGRSRVRGNLASAGVGTALWASTAPSLSTLSAAGVGTAAFVGRGVKVGVFSTTGLGTATFTGIGRQRASLISGGTGLASWTAKLNKGNLNAGGTCNVNWFGIATGLTADGPAFKTAFQRQFSKGANPSALTEVVPPDA